MYACKLSHCCEDTPVHSNQTRVTCGVKIVSEAIFEHLICNISRGKEHVCLTSLLAPAYVCTQSSVVLSTSGFHYRDTLATKESSILAVYSSVTDLTLLGQSYGEEERTQRWGGDKNMPLPVVLMCVAHSSVAPLPIPPICFLLPLISLYTHIYTYMQLIYYQGKHG